jgi:uncharacterized protein DUF222
VCEGSPGSVSEALAQLRGALDFLNASDAASLPGAVQAGVLRELERTESRHTAARARFLAAFTAQGHCEADGQATARAWLKWQTQVTSAAAAGAAGWSKRLPAHPVIDHALATGQLSASWARHLCTWTSRLPEHARDHADHILCQAAADGMALRDLGDLAEEIYQRTRPPVPSADDGDRFEDRCLQLGATLGGAGRVEGDLTPGATHALATVLDALGTKAGPEDTRTAAQRRHDALEQACRRLIAGGLAPARAGQPTHLTVHMTLSQLRGLPHATGAEHAWLAAHAATHPGWLTGPDADAAACDATITPIVTGHLDPTALDQLTHLFRASHPPATTTPGTGTPGTAASGSGMAAPRTATTPATGPPTPPAPGGTGPPAPGTPFAAAEPGTTLAPATRDRLRRALLALAIQALSGPAGLAAHLRTTLTSTATPPANSNPPPAGDLTPPGDTTRPPTSTPTQADSTPLSASSTATLPAAALSLPLDIGAATVTIPAHIRKAAAIRHRHCAFPGCRVPFTACDLHHLQPRSHGGPTRLTNLVPLCHFHHHIAIHRWGWKLTLHPDATTTATSPDNTRTYHSHSPPSQAA